MTCTLNDIAKKTGFSVSTVSRVLHDHKQRYKISRETKATINRVAQELGYSPNKLARGLRLQKSHEIGVIVPDISNPFFATMVKSVSKEARKSGYGILVLDSDEDSTIEEDALQALMERRVDGLLVAGVGEQDGHLRRISASGLPLVLLDRWPKELCVDAVSVDNVQGAYQATQHLIREGHRRIAFIQGLRATSSNQGRLQGYLRALDEACIEPDSNYIVGDDFRSINGYRETKSLLLLENPPSAIFTAGDLIALGALQALKEMGVACPTGMSLLTFDDPSYALYLSPPLTAVEQPIEKMGELGVTLLLRRMRNPGEAVQQVLLDPRLVVRESVARIDPVEAPRYSQTP
jgi:LacI family transcriptional regulator